MVPFLVGLVVGILTEPLMQRNWMLIPGLVIWTCTLVYTRKQALSGAGLVIGSIVASLWIWKA